MQHKIDLTTKQAAKLLELDALLKAANNDLILYASAVVDGAQFEKPGVYMGVEAGDPSKLIIELDE